MSISKRARANAPNPSQTVFRPRRLVGRDTEFRDVSESVTSAPVTTLLGPGGVGKTALAITVAAACSQDLPGGVTVAWLGSLGSAELVAAEGWLRSSGCRDRVRAPVDKERSSDIVGDLLRQLTCFDVLSQRGE